MNKPTQEQIATIASHVFAGGQHSAKWAVRFALKIWEETARQLNPDNEKDTDKE